MNCFSILLKLFTVADIVFFSLAWICSSTSKYWRAFINLWRGNYIMLVQNASLVVKLSCYWTSAAWMTTSKYSLHGAHMISFFLERMRRKVRSLLGSRSLTVLRAFCVRLHNSPAYCTVVELSNVVRIGMPSWLMTMVPMTPLCPCILLRTSSTSLMLTAS